MGRHMCLLLCSLVVTLVLACKPSAATAWHGLFEHRLYEDHVSGVRYEPQPSAFEAALKKIREAEEAAKVTGFVAKRKAVVDEVNVDSLHLDVEDHQLPTGHPHKGRNQASRPTRARGSFEMAADELMLGSRQLGGGSKTVVGGSRVAVNTEKACRKVLTDDTSGDEFMRRMLDTSSKTNTTVTITNGANAPGPDIPPSEAAISSNYFRMGSVLPHSYVDWAMTGAATYVHIEGAFCQSCWAIAVADAVSMLWLINSGWGNHPVDPSMTDPRDINYGNPSANGQADMSAQQICDCMGVSCCMGGWPESALEYVQLNGGLASSANYPMTNSVNATQCNSSQASNIGAQISGFETVPAGNITAFMQAVSMLPVIAFVSSSSLAFGNYTGGVFSGPCDPTGTVDHVVLITGYGTDPTAGPYWIIKNSWGPYWGEGGYMRIAMQPGNGVCGITSSDGLYPVYFPTSGNPCQAIPNPCGSGTCFVQELPGSTAAVARCGCPTGYVENLGTWPSPSQCVPADPCGINPAPCGAGTCSSNPDGSYSCTCPAAMAIGSAADGSPLCVSGTTRTYTAQPTDTCSIITAAYSLAEGTLPQQNPWVNCSMPLLGGAVVLLGATPVPAGSSTYVTQAPDTCAGIAYGYGVSASVLIQYNPTLNCSALTQGTSLAMPPPSGSILPDFVSSVCLTAYVVKTGDTCASVAANASLSLSRLMGMNPDINCTLQLDPPITLCLAAATDSVSITPGAPAEATPNLHSVLTPTPFPSSQTQTPFSSTCTSFFTVRQGDSCPFIWNYASLSMNQFFQLNPGVRCDAPHLRLGEVVCVGGPNMQVAIPIGFPYASQPGDSPLSIADQFTRRCGSSASLANLRIANPKALPANASTIPVGVQLLIPCANAGSSDSCGCGAYANNPVCGNDYAWYFNSCDCQCNGAGYGYPSCTVCAQACFGRVTLGPLSGTPYGCTANNGGLCLPSWDGSCQHWLNGCANECSYAQQYGTPQNNQYWPCFAKCRGNC